MIFPETPRFLFAPDEKSQQLYIIHTRFPLSVIWVKQTIPAQLLIIETEMYDDDDDDPETDLLPEEQEELAQLLLDAAEWYRTNAITKSN